MNAYKLDKSITLYRNQFEDCITEIYRCYKLERLSIDLDSILFKIRYIVDNNKDQSNMNFLKDEFIQTALELRSVFGTFLVHMLREYVGFPDDCSDINIIDILSKEVSIDAINVSFDISLVSDKIEYLEYVNDVIPDEGVFNIKPNSFFRFSTDSYNDGIAKAYPELFSQRTQDEVGTGKDADIFCHNFTFQTSEDCSLNCTYCYQFNKSNMRMSFDTAKEFIDKLLNDEYTYINRHNSPAIIIEFIGGEPLMEMHLTRRIYEYFLEQTFEMDHPWFKLHRLSICSNGMQYFDKNVQEFFKKYAHHISFNISIDGNKGLHDSCRIQPNGEGSYDVDILALKHYTANYAPERNSKMTLAPENIHHLFESVVHFINSGMLVINLNCIFEEGWNQKTAKTEYNQLKLLADYILENDLEHLYIAIFNERQEDKQDPSNDGNFCGGTGSMLSLRSNGEFYPCIRYMPTSIGSDRMNLCLGDVTNGFVGREEGSEVLGILDAVTRRAQSNDVCYECPIGNDCAWCSALSHTVYGTPNKRPMFACIQMIAEALANVYYWNLLNIKHPEYNLGVRYNNVPEEWALLVIDKEELDSLYNIESMSTMTTMIEKTRRT